MAAMTCPTCSGTGYTQHAAGDDGVCPMCDGTGILIEENAVDPG
jgi:DnaJ-class molecular chaperone